MIKKFVYREYELKNKILENIGLNNYTAKIVFFDKENINQNLIIITEFKYLTNNDYITNTSSSIINNNQNIESYNGSYSQKVKIIDIKNQDPFQLVKKLFNTVKTTTLIKTITGYQRTMLDTFSLKLWENNQSSLNSKQATNPTESAAITTSCSGTSTTCNNFSLNLSSCSGTTTGTTETVTCNYGTQNCGSTTDPCSVCCEYTIGSDGSDLQYYVEAETNVNIYGDLTITSPGKTTTEGNNGIISYGTLNIYGDVTLDGFYTYLSTSVSGTSNPGEINIYGNLTISGTGCYLNAGSSSSITGTNINIISTGTGTTETGGNVYLCSGSEGSIFINPNNTCTIDGYLCFGDSSTYVTNNGTFSYYDSNSNTNISTAAGATSSCQITTTDCGNYSGCTYPNCPSSS